MGIWNIAHRGGAQLRAENTLSAFADAVWRGCHGAELDVQLSRDGEVIVHHDWRLKPELTRNGDGRWLTPPMPRIKDLPFEALRAFDVGRADPDSEYARTHSLARWQDGECIPLLSEVIAVAKTARTPFRLFVELKTSFANRDESAPPDELAERTLAVLDEYNYLDRTIFVGFDWAALIHMKKLAPKAQCWFTSLPESWFKQGTPPPEHNPPSEEALRMLRYWAHAGVSPWAAGFDAIHHGGSILEAIKAAGGDGWDPMWVDINEESVADARRLGLKIGTWTVNDPDEMKFLIGLGIDAIYTDRPDLLMALSC